MEVCLYGKGKEAHLTLARGGNNPLTHKENTELRVGRGEGRGTCKNGPSTGGWVEGQELMEARVYCVSET